MPPSVRHAEPVDFDSIRPLLELMGHVSEASLQERFKEYVSSPYHCILVAIDQKDVIGYAWAQSYGPHLRSGKTLARLHDLAVSPQHRRRGVGRALFETVIGWCQESHVVELQWQAGRDVAAFYERLGVRGDTKSDLEEYPYYEIEIRPSS